ncbi:MAG: DUF2490 domain-containing protein [Ginsengibacter sp.]
MNCYWYIKKFISLICFSLLIQLSFGQQKATGSWTLITIKHNFNAKWNGYVEYQIRSLSPYSRFYYNEIEAGTSYSIHKNTSATFGTGYYDIFNEGEKFDNYKKKTEFRIWEQFSIKQHFYSIELQHRFRLEQQFVDSYTNRFRYRLNATIPINNKEIKPKTVYFSLYDEVFFSEKVPNFSKNRFYVGPGYVFNQQFTLQAGLLKQVEFSVGSQRRKNYLFTSFTYTF